MKRYSYVTIFMLAGISSVSMATNPVLVDKAGGGDFTTIQSAIDSWCAGGANAGETAPFVVNIKAGSGPYDEAVNIEEGFIGHGNVMGDITVKSDTSGTAVVVKLQPTAGSLLNVGETQGMIISQSNYNVTFRDLVFTRSLVKTPLSVLIRQDENVPINDTVNTVAFYNCVFTEVTAAGDPMVTTKTEALVAPPPRGGAARNSGAYLFQSYEDPDDSISIVLDDCTFYGGSSTNCYIRSDGHGAEKVTIHNTLSSYPAAYPFQVGGVNPLLEINVTGTDVSAGPLHCTAALFPGADYHCFYIRYTVASQVTHISNFLADSSQAPSNAASRGISGGNGALFLSHCIINSQAVGVVDITNVPTTWDHVTINCPNNAYLNADGTAGSLTVSDSVISGSGTKFAGNLIPLPVGFVTVKRSALPTSGANAITATGNITEDNNINADPLYVATDYKLATYFDVANGLYASAGTDSSALAGGANYVGFPAGINDWNLY